MTQAEKERSIMFCEGLIALVCSYIAAAAASEAVVSSNTLLYNLTGVTSFYQLLWLGYDTAWILLMLAVLSFLAAFGLLNRIAGNFSEWRLNWAVIPFVGTFIFILNLAWYFQPRFNDYMRPLVLLTYTFGGGFMLVGISCVIWLGGFAYRIVKHDLDASEPLP